MNSKTAYSTVTSVAELAKRFGPFGCRQSTRHPLPALFGLIVVATIFQPSRTRADDSQWKLQPLAYNSPGLVTDLGVGLWAWPLPMDYDNDGDMDLLVACPDKPSRGVYYFENPTQDPSAKFPVFKAGVRIGQAHQYMQVSNVAGEPVITRPGYEYRRDSETGKFDFDKPMRIESATNPHQSGGRTRAHTWKYVDMDADQDQDLVIGIGDWSDYGWDHAYDSQGRWLNGPLHGYVYCLKNTGNDAQPQYAATEMSARRLQAAGGDVDVYGWPSPNFADFDGDGDLDLLCGEFLDGFTYFQNIGTSEKMLLAAGQRLCSADGQPLVMDLQMITPTAVDWDADGDIDLVVGDEDGRVALVEHTGVVEDQVPVFAPPRYFRQEADTLKFGALATPVAHDWDGDGDEDIICGNTAGHIGWFENQGASDGGLPQWSAANLLHVIGDAASAESEPFRILAGPSGSIQGPCEAKWGYTTLSVADWDNDGDGDILYNSIHAQVGLLLNEGGRLKPSELVSPAASGTSTSVGVGQSASSFPLEFPPRWSWLKTESSSTLTQWRTTPVAVDFNADGTLDLVMLDQAGFLTLRSAAGPARRIFVDEQNRPLQLNSKSAGGSGRVKLAVVDWDGDGRLDVLVNSENATWLRNCETRGETIVLKRIGNLADRNVAGHTSSPAACDLDRNGKPDLLVGSENGRIYFIAHEDCVTYAEEDLQADAPESASEAKFPGWLSEDFVYEAAAFPECHASTICSTSRGLVVAWFGGKKEGTPDVGIWTSYYDGGSWSSPVEVANGIQHEDLRYPCWNPVLFQAPGDGPLMLFFKVGPSPSTWWGEMMVSYDRGRTFKERRRLPEGIDGPVRCKPLWLEEQGKLLCGSSTEYDGWVVHFESIDLVGGLPHGDWKRVGPINSAKEFNAIQPTFLTHGDGRLQVLCRTKESVITSSFSADQGATWSPMVAIHLPNPNSGIDAVTLDDGRQLLIYNHLDSGKTGWGRRGLINLAISDDGLTWRKIGVLDREQGAEFSYPAMIQAEDGLIHITYTWKRDRVKHVVVDPNLLVPGKTLSLEAWDEDAE